MNSTEKNKFGPRQSSYRILVASSVALLEADMPEMWDSKWIDSDEMSQILYTGSNLESDNTYYWKVAVKDENIEVSKWSAIAKWTTGL